MPSKKPKKPVPHNVPTPEKRTPTEVLAATRQLLRNAELGLTDIRGNDPGRRISGLHNVATFGRSVTLGLQRLKHIAPGFDQWYTEVIPADDPLLSYFTTLRNLILKEVSSPTLDTKVHIEHFHGDPLQMLQGPPPAGAISAFVGERGTGGSGWIVRMPDGSEEKYYSALSPRVTGEVTTHLPDPPQSFLGEPITNTTVSNIAGLYVRWLGQLVSDAEGRFK